MKINLESIGIFIGVLIGIYLAPTIATEVTANAGNFTGATLALWNLIPLFYVLCVAGIAIAGVYLILKGQ